MACAARALAVLRESGADAGVVAHCRVVAGVATRICSAHPRIDRRLVQAGALLHDVGRARTHGIRHGVVGAGMLRERGCEEALALMAERHIGAGLTATEAMAMGLPERDYLPVSLEEKVVAHADNLVGGTRYVGVQECLRRARARMPVRAVERMVALHFEVFPPLVVPLPEGAGLDPDAVIAGLDALARVRGGPGGEVLELSGFQAGKAARKARATLKRDVAKW